MYLQTPIVLRPAVSNWAGLAETARFPIPFAPWLRGARQDAQAFVADPQGPVLGLTFTAAQAFVLGD